MLYGSASGLSTRDQLWHQNRFGIESYGRNEEEFGHALAAGDFNGDGVDDLSIGSPEESFDALEDFQFEGAVHVLFGSRGGQGFLARRRGLTAGGSQFWHQDVPGIKGVGQEGDLFGGAVGAGDFDGDGQVDLAIGAPGENGGQLSGRGAVHVLYELSSVILISTVLSDQLWSQNSTGILGFAETEDQFGFSLSGGSQPAYH